MRGGAWAETVAIFERQVLVFPLLVVLFACTSFLFGGRCAAWQWWTAVAAVTLVPFARRGQWRSALGAAGLFALLLFALRCLIPPFVWDDTSCADMPVYHLPMVQLLIEGWNPVADPMADGIAASLGLDLWGMAPLHVAFLPKTLAVFSAVAYTFVHDPYALTFPLPVFLWISVLLQAFRSFRGFPRLAVSAAIVGILPIVTLQMPVDLCVAFSSCGLLLTMQDALRRKKCDWLALGLWAAWMMNLKLNGVLGAFVFCAVFVAATIWKNRIEWKQWFGRFAAFGGVLVLLWALVSWNPLGTSWKYFGHPLYPFKTIDANRFPVMDLTWEPRPTKDEQIRSFRARLHLAADDRRILSLVPEQAGFRTRRHLVGLARVSNWSRPYRPFCSIRHSPDSSCRSDLGNGRTCADGRGSGRCHRFHAIPALALGSRLSGRRVAW